MAEESPERLAPRPERTADERKARADELRRVYAADPSTWPAPHVDPDVKWKEIGLLPEVEHPADNPHTTEKETLGKTLFFDPRLSGSGQIACASCHDPDLGWADGRTTSFGHSRKQLARNSPTIRNTAFQQRLFWDGRADSLEDQARQVLMNPDEMRSGPEHVVALL
jgi:cytochrome c peroxidase